MPEDPVSYRQMVEYMSKELRPVLAHMREHDTWHLGNIQAEAKAHTQTIRANISMIIAGAAVIVACLAIVFHH